MQRIVYFKLNCEEWNIIWGINDDIALNFTFLHFDSQSVFVCDLNGFLYSFKDNSFCISSLCRVEMEHGLRINLYFILDSDFKVIKVYVRISKHIFSIHHNCSVPLPIYLLYSFCFDVILDVNELISI